MEKPFRALRILSVVFQVVAWGALAIGVAGAIGILVGNVPNTPRQAGLAILGISALYFCLFSAFSGILTLLLTLEERSRPTV